MFDEFFSGYVQALGFTAQEWGDNPEPLFPGSGQFDDNWNVWDEIAPLIDVDQLQTIATDALEFWRESGLESWNNLEPEDAGHDFHLTRNGHGCGFWDGDWPEPFATRLTELSKTFGTLELEGTRDSDGELISIELGE